jgi:hypothetical protein
VNPLNQYLDGNAFRRSDRRKHLRPRGNAARFPVRQFLTQSAACPVDGGQVCVNDHGFRASGLKSASQIIESLPAFIFYVALLCGQA